MDYGGAMSRTFTRALDCLAEAITSRNDRFVLFVHPFRGQTFIEHLGYARPMLQVFNGDDDLVRQLRTLQPDIVHTHFARFDFAAVRGAPSSRVFWHAHSSRDSHSPYERLKALIRYRIIGSRVEAIVAVSEAVRKDCINFFAPRDRVRVVYNGIDTSHFRPPAASERTAARRKYGVAPSDRVVLFFERLPYKGGATLRKALENLQGVRLLVVGGSTQDRDRFNGLPGLLSHARVEESRELYWAADVLAFPSEHEGFGLVLIEALACELPIAASNIPVVQEVCGNLASVALFPVGDPQGLASSLKTALARTPDDSGRQRVVNLFSVESWTSRILQLYDN